MAAVKRLRTTSTAQVYYAKPRVIHGRLTFRMPIWERNAELFIKVTTSAKLIAKSDRLLARMNGQLVSEEHESETKAIAKKIWNEPKVRKVPSESSSVWFFGNG